MTWMCPSYTTVKNWARDVRCGREQVEDEPRSGRPSTAVTDENIQAEGIFMEDRRITLDEIADILGISHERIHHISNLNASVFLVTSKHSRHPICTYLKHL